MKAERKTVPCSPNKKTKGMLWFARMLDSVMGQTKFRFTERLKIG